jgi:hypothetical protein
MLTLQEQPLLNKSKGRHREPGKFSPGMLQLNDSWGEKSLPGLEILERNTEQEGRITFSIFI